MDALMNLMHRAGASLTGRTADESAPKGVSICIRCHIYHVHRMLHTHIYVPILSREVDHQVYILHIPPLMLVEIAGVISLRRARRKQQLLMRLRERD